MGFFKKSKKETFNGFENFSSINEPSTSNTNDDLQNVEIFSDKVGDEATSAFNDESNVKEFQKKANLKLFGLGLFSSLALFGALSSYVLYNSNSERIRQTIAYSNQLVKNNEQIAKELYVLNSLNMGSFDSLQNNRKEIDSILKVLKGGGKIDGRAVDIKPLVGDGALLLSKYDLSWKDMSADLEYLSIYREDLQKLKNDFLTMDSDFSKILSSSYVISNKSSVSVKDVVTSLLNIKKEINGMFSGGEITIERGVAIAEEMKGLMKKVSDIKSENGLSSEVVAEIEKFEKMMTPYLHFSKTLSSSIEYLVKSKKTILDLDRKTEVGVISAAAIESYYYDVYSMYNYYKYIPLVLFVLSLLGVAMIALIIYERSFVVFKVAAEYQKNKFNDQAVNDLLIQIEPIDNGDFSRKIVVEDVFLLKVAEKIDKTRKLFSEIIRKIKDSSQDISATAANTEVVSQKLLDVSVEQYAKLEKSISSIGEITNAMDEIAQTTWVAQEESNNSFEQAKNGEELVNQAISKMNEIRNTIQESSKKIKKLGESAQSITEVTGLIKDITKQINILALNAAIQAASSGESGREFTIVAQEVQRLADDSELATKKIEGLISDIQIDTAAAISSMEKTTQEVVVGAKLNNSAGVALREISSLSKTVAEQVSSAAKTLEEKSAEIARIVFDMQLLQKTAEESNTDIKLTYDQIEALRFISQELDQMVNEYRI